MILCKCNARDSFTQTRPTNLTPKCKECINYCNTLKPDINAWNTCILETFETEVCECPVLNY